MPSIQKTAKGYRAQVKFKGIRESKIFRTKTEASNWAASRIFDLKKQAESSSTNRELLHRAIDRYINEVTVTERGARWEKLRLSQMRSGEPPFVDGLMVDQVTPEMIAEWRDERLKEVAPGTVLREMGILSALFDTCLREWGLITKNPVRMVRKPPRPEHRDALYTRSQIKAILKACKHSPRGNVRYVSQAVANCFLVALRTGMRAGELTGLAWDRVFHDHVFLPVTKTKKRNVPMSSKARRVLERMRGYDPVMVFGLPPQSLDANFRKYRERAGVTGMTFHDSRHYAATQMAKKVDVLTLCKIFGWTNTKQALTYFNPTPSEVSRLLDGP